MIQVVILIATAPMFLMLAAYMLQMRPPVNQGFWYALIVLMFVLSLVSLRDAYLINYFHVPYTWYGMGVRVLKLVAVTTCLVVAVRESRRGVVDYDQRSSDDGEP